jgi:threonine/homoserine/homoserine lactone efflux protein
MMLSALGLGTALAASEKVFTALKWLGAIYLAYLGITSFFSSVTEINVADRVTASSSGRLFAQGFLVGASNPKALFFFGALFPQFIIPNAPQLPQFLVLGATFIFFELLWLTLYALSASKAKRWLQQPGRAKLFNRATGVVFVVAAGLLATSKRANAV